MHRSDPETTAPKEQVAEKIGSGSQEKASFPGFWPRPFFKRWRQRRHYYNADKPSGEDVGPSGEDVGPSGEDVGLAFVVIFIEVSDGPDASNFLDEPEENETFVAAVAALFGPNLTDCWVEFRGYNMSAFDDTEFSGDVALKLAQIKQASNVKAPTFEGDLLFAEIECKHPLSTGEAWLEGIESNLSPLAANFRALVAGLGVTGVEDAGIVYVDFDEELDEEDEEEG
ncbi:unnamed protein product [Symbiodinium sp. CCMP2592]|nr:unnamed protein product [Symbiodinium sp. CCMP2592]